MRRIAVSFGADWQASGALFTNAALDYATNVSAYSHPALVAQRAVSSTTTETGAALLSATAPAGPLLPQASLSNTQGQTTLQWSALGPFALTTQSGDQISFATTAFQVTIQLAGLLTAGMGAQCGSTFSAASIRNGARVAILVDGTVVQTLDTYNATPQLVLYLDGLTHTVAIQHTGGYNGAISPIGPVTPTVGTSVSAMLAPTATYHPTFVRASWRILATGASTYSLYKTPPGGSESLVASGLSTGTTYSGSSYVPGVNLLVNSTTALTTNDAATFTTDSVMLALESVSFGTGTGSGAATWTSPVYDFGDPATQMVAAELVQSTPLSKVVVASGNTATPDGSWTTVTTKQSSATTADGTQYGTAGLMAAPPGRYGQLTLQLQSVGTVAPWIRDLVVYAWNPAADPLGSRLVLHARQQLGPNLHAYLAALATWYADLRQAYLDLRAAGSIGGAKDSYLSGYLGDVGLAQITGEPPAAARARARGVLSSAGSAGAVLSIVGIAQQLNLLVNGVQAPCTVTGSAGSWLASCGGVLVQQTAAMGYTVQIPGAPYSGLPGLPVGPSSTAGTANAIIADYIKTTLRPVGSHPTVTFTTSS